MKGRYRYRNKKSTDDKIRRTSQSTVLKSGYTVNQTWKCLRKAWLGYTIARQIGILCKGDSKITKGIRSAACDFSTSRYR